MAEGRLRRRGSSRKRGWRTSSIIIAAFGLVMLLGLIYVKFNLNMTPPPNEPVERQRVDTPTVDVLHQERESLQRKVKEMELKVAEKEAELLALQRQQEYIPETPAESEQPQFVPPPPAPEKAELVQLADTVEEIPDVGAPQDPPIRHQHDNVDLAKLGHYMLGLQEEEFRSQPVDELMSHYKSDKCDHSFGNGLVSAWRAKGKNCCSDPKGSKDASSIRCHLMKQDGHAGNGDQLCHMQNVAVDFSAFSDPKVIVDVMTKYRDSKHSDEAYIHHKRGTVQGTCQPDQAQWQDKFFPGWNAEWTTKAYQKVDALRCDLWVDHPVIIVQRDTFANFFHDSEDFVNVFLALAILKWNTQDTQVLLTDLYPDGPFWDMWGSVFNGGVAPMLAWDIAHQYGDQRVCFRDLAIGIYGPAAPTTIAAVVTPCSGCALVKAYSDFVIRGLGLQARLSYNRPPSKKVVITWMTRQSSVPWPERAFCGKTGDATFFTCNYFEHLGTRPLQRIVQNDAKVVKDLKAKFRNAKFPNGAQVEFREVDYNLLVFEDQITNDMETDIMVGPHGAGLYHNIFMPDRGVLMELLIDGTSPRKHFLNLASWYGRKYVPLEPPNPVPPEQVFSALCDIIKNMDLSQH